MSCSFWSCGACFAVEGVRLVHMDRDELAEIDLHPLVRANMDATMLLAELFVAKSGVDGPLCESLTICISAGGTRDQHAIRFPVPFAGLTVIRGSACHLHTALGE